MNSVDKCKFCGSTEIYVADSRMLPNGMRKRTRECMECLQRTFSLEMERTEYQNLESNLEKYKNVFKIIERAINGEL